ncbi:MAG: hypothetical protein ACRDHF_06145, partial [Tepidiformaceae bacterium]
MSVTGLALGLVMVAASGRGGDAAAVELPDVEGEAWIMRGVAYNTQQPAPDPSFPLHFVGMPPGGANENPLNYAFPSNSELLLYAASSRVVCSGTGQAPGASSAFAFCEVVLEGFELWVGPYKIIEASRVRVASSSTSGNGVDAKSFPSIQIEGLCVFIE